MGKREIKTDRVRNNSPLAIIPVAAGILLNYMGSKFAAAFDLPIYLDNIGTICASILGGYLPGIITGIINNAINYAFDTISIYYASVSAMIAIAAAYFYRKKKLSSFTGILSFIFVIAFAGGFIGGIITWALSGPATSGTAYAWMVWVRDHLVNNDFWAHILSTFALDFIDKALTCCVALFIIKLIPEQMRKRFWLSGWKQTPVMEEAYKYENNNEVNGHSLNTRIGLVLVLATLSMALIVTGVSSTLFRDYSKEQHFTIARGVAELAATTIDADRVDEYLEEGEKATGYAATEKRLTAVKNSSPDIEYVYVYKIEEDGCHVVFDLDTDELKGEEPGTVVEFDEAFAEYIPDLLQGKDIDPIESNDKYGWLLTVYEPVYNLKGDCVCYACADVAVGDISEYQKDFVFRVVLLYFGFFILILAAGLWLSKYQLILPVNSMASVAGEFAFNDDSLDEAMAEENLARMLALRIRTGDEIQDMYEAFCKMTNDSVRHMKSIRKQADEISDLQRGLILTMADMVEGRDSDTGNHIRKTAAYVSIIMEGLRRKGYYKDELTDKFIYDVERSAPLHDIGKIAVSDVILNKPGKLTDEEFEIMKTHTTEGKRILSQVIETVHGESYLNEGRNLAAYHHEKWNGKGYPEGLAGEDIPLSARIMAIADVFDALSSKRVYKDAMPFEKAVSIIKEDSGTHFDPKCVEAFLDSLDEVKEVLDYYNELEAEGEGVRGNEIKTEEHK